MGVPEQQRQRQRSRLAGVDVARGVALLGMMAVHVFPSVSDEDGGTTLVHHLASGRASALFAVLAGVGLALLSGGARPRVDGKLREGVLVRVALVALVGLVVGQLDSGLAVILVYYGVLFLVAVPLLPLRAPVLAALAVLAAVVTPVLSFLLRPSLPDRLLGNPSAELLLTDPVTLLTTLLVTGYYPVLCWTTYLCAGLAVGRLDLASRAVAVRLAVGGAGLAVAASLVSALLLGPLGGLDRIEADLTAGSSSLVDLDVRAEVAGNQFGNVPADGSPWWLATDAPHSSTTFDLLHTTGTALLVLGVALLLAPRLGVLVRPLAALGAMTLTLYSVHVLVVAITDGERPGVLWSAQVAVFAVFAVLWLRAFPRGPLETVVAAAARR